MSKDNHVHVRPVRSYDGADGFRRAGSAPYAVSHARAAELRANRLVEYADPVDDSLSSALAQADAKAARPARNKMAPAPANKST